MKEKKKKIDKKAIILIITILLLIVSGVVIYFIVNSESQNCNLSTLNSKELKKYLEENGYEFNSKSVFDYDIVLCTNNTIGFLAIFNKENHLIKYINYENSDISSENCNIWNNSQNITEESKKLYSNYLEWLKKYNLKDTQIIDLLFNYYYEVFNIKLD